jgi:hypothetical protein
MCSLHSQYGAFYATVLVRSQEHETMTAPEINALTLSVAPTYLSFSLSRSLPLLFLVDMYLRHGC